MFEQFRAAIAGAQFRQVHDLTKKVCAAHGADYLDDDSAQSLLEALQARRRALATHVAPASKRLASDSLNRSAPRSPDRERSICRRRAVAMSGKVPSTIAARFTVGELAVLTIIARDCQRRKLCDAPIDAIAARAGVSRSTVKRAMRVAVELGLISVRERRRAGLKSLTNVTVVVSNEWRAWLRLGGGDRGSKPDHHGKHIFLDSVSMANTAANGARGHRSSSVTLKQGLFEEASRISSPS